MSVIVDNAIGLYLEGIPDGHVAVALEKVHRRPLHEDGM
jgi:hypothetical protein